MSADELVRMMGPDVVGEWPPASQYLQPATAAYPVQVLGVVRQRFVSDGLGQGVDDPLSMSTFTSI